MFPVPEPCPWQANGDLLRLGEGQEAVYRALWRHRLDIARSASHLCYAQLGVLPHVKKFESGCSTGFAGAIANKTEGILTALAEVNNLATYHPEMRAAVELWESKLHCYTAVAKSRLEKCAAAC